MKAAKFTFFRRVTAFCPSAALMLAMLLLAVAAPTAAAQGLVFVPGNASGCFGSPADKCVPLVAALTIRKPMWVMIEYVSGTVNYGTGEAGASGVPFTAPHYQQVPLQEAIGVSLKTTPTMGALIGVFAPLSTIRQKGFRAVDGTKNAARAGIMPNGLFFIGGSQSFFFVDQPGKLFLGINDNWVGDNSGGFIVMVVPGTCSPEASPSQPQSPC
ncbi:MAG: hypothetical protein ABSD64_13610 [Terriglobales bacterium]|jgi:hypothetical protein